MSSITLLSPAKVNLTLEVLGKRPDGYHEIRSLLQPVDLFDELTIETTGGDGIEISSSGIEIPPGEDNLAWQAADMFLNESGFDSGLAISIKPEEYRQLLIPHRLRQSLHQARTSQVR